MKDEPKFTKKNPPLNADGSPKKTFEVKRREVNGRVEQAIFVDGELFDFEIDWESMNEAAKMGPEYLEAARKDLQKYFCECLSEVVGREVTSLDILKANQHGWI